MLLGLLASCSGKPATGAERGPCYGNGTCDDGLVCLSELCVDAKGRLEERVSARRARRYARKEATVEARQNVKRIYDGARAYYLDRSGANGSTKQFPAVSVGPTPPLGECCKHADGVCPPNASWWTDEAWVALQFSVDEPHRYSYAYYVGDPKDGAYTAQAMGDLDCDGVYATFEMYGTIDDEHPDGPDPNAGIYRQNELE